MNPSSPRKPLRSIPAAVRDGYEIGPLSVPDQVSNSESFHRTRPFCPVRGLSTPGQRVASLLRYNGG